MRDDASPTSTWDDSRGGAMSGLLVCRGKAPALCPCRKGVSYAGIMTTPDATPHADGVGRDDGSRQTDGARVAGSALHDARTRLQIDGPGVDDGVCADGDNSRGDSNGTRSIGLGEGSPGGVIGSGLSHSGLSCVLRSFCGAWADTEFAAGAVYAATQVFTPVESPGGVESLIEHPMSMTHASVAGPDLAVPPGLVRLSVDIADTAYQVADLRRALTEGAL